MTNTFRFLDNAISSLFDFWLQEVNDDLVSLLFFNKVTGNVYFEVKVKKSVFEGRLKKLMV